MDTWKLHYCFCFSGLRSKGNSRFYIMLSHDHWKWRFRGKNPGRDDPGVHKKLALVPAALAVHADGS